MSSPAPGRPLDAEWLRWLETNVARGCSKEELTGILLSNGFGGEAIREAIAQAASAARPAAAPAAIDPPRRVKPRLANAQRFESAKIELYTAEDFLTAAECAELVALIQSELRPSTISTPPAGEYDKAFRTSRTCDLSTAHPCVARLDAKIYAAMGIDAIHAEPTQGQHYEVGQVFKAHTDFFKPYELERFSTATHGQRTWTFMVYLGVPEAGGETRFNDVGLTVTPRLGMAVAWNNLLRTGEGNAFTRHESMPVTAGTKTIITKWFRTPRKAPALFSSAQFSWSQKA